MTERKVLIVRVKGGMQIVQGVTNYIIEGLARDIGVDRWKLIGKALDKLEEEMEK